MMKFEDGFLKDKELKERVEGIRGRRNGILQLLVSLILTFPIEK